MFTHVVVEVKCDYCKGLGWFDCKRCKKKGRVRKAIPFEEFMAVVMAEVQKRAGSKKE